MGGWGLGFKDTSHEAELEILRRRLSELEGRVQTLEHKDARLGPSPVFGQKWRSG